MKVTFEIDSELADKVEALNSTREDETLEETLIYALSVGVSTIVQRNASQKKQLERSKAARRALAYVEAQGIKL